MAPVTLQGLGALWQQLWRHDRRGDDLCKNPRFGANWAILKVYGLKVRDLGLRFMNRVWVLGSCRPQEMGSGLGLRAWDWGPEALYFADKREAAKGSCFVENFRVQPSHKQ